MRRWDVVIPRLGQPLRSGASAYSHAIVLHVEPFVLVSEGSDMRWSATVSAYCFRVVGRATWRTRLRVLRRWRR